MWNRIEKILMSFRDQFSRRAAFRWFVVIAVGLMLRTDKMGITSVLRDLSIAPGHYESIMHFFRAASWSILELQARWCKTVGETMPLFKPEGRAILVGDGTKVSKEGRYMPGVKRHVQDSETQSKPEYIYGHMWGGTGILVGQIGKFFCTPLSLRIHDGLQALSGWDDGEPESHVVQMIKDGCHAAQHLAQSALFLLDRYYLSVPALKELSRQNTENHHRVDIITRLKKSSVAYEPAPERLPGQRGRTRKKGDKVKLFELFQSKKEQFKVHDLELYGKLHQIRYCSVDLLWGLGLYQKLRFVLVECQGTQSIPATTDLSLAPLMVIQLYSYRFRIELTFRELKQQIGAFSYHFWTKAMPKLNHFQKKTDPDPITQVTDPQKREQIRLTVRATQCYALMASIAMGILQSLSIDFSNGLFKLPLRYQRTPVRKNPSEANMMFCLRQHIFSFLNLHAKNEIPHLILSAQSLPEANSSDPAA